MSVRYEVEVDQSTVVEMIEVKLYQLEHWEQRNPSDGYLGAVVKWDHDTKQISYLVVPNVRISGRFTPDQARDVAEWWRLAASTAEMLQRTITGRADFDKRWQARIVGLTVALDEAKEAVTA